MLCFQFWDYQPWARTWPSPQVTSTDRFSSFAIWTTYLCFNLHCRTGKRLERGCWCYAAWCNSFQRYWHQPFRNCHSQSFTIDQYIRLQPNFSPRVPLLLPLLFHSTSIPYILFDCFPQTHQMNWKEVCYKGYPRQSTAPWQKLHCHCNSTSGGVTSGWGTTCTLETSNTDSQKWIQHLQCPSQKRIDKTLKIPTWSLRKKLWCVHVTAMTQSTARYSISC